MSAVQSASIAHRNGKLHDNVADLIEQAIDANGDPLKGESGNGSTASSSEEDIATCSSKEDEKEEVIHLKTR